MQALVVKRTALRAIAALGLAVGALGMPSPMAHAGPAVQRVASAGNGGTATANANGGAVTIGDINSGGNSGTAIGVGDTWGGVRVDGGTVTQTTTVPISADGGTAIADASGGRWPVVRQGASGEAVKSLQRLLRQHGHAVDVDGDYGSQTTQAVRAFQQARRLGVDGIVGPQTWSALIVTVRHGSQGEAVRAVQGQLATRGVALSVDGDYGSQTAAAVRAYQQRLDLAVDGVVGPQSWEALLAGR